MKEILLSMPELYFALLFIVALLITALRTRETVLPVGEPRSTGLPTGRDVAVAPVMECCDLDRAPLSSFVVPPPCDHRPFRDLKAALSATYAAKLEQALRTIHISQPAVARPTDQAAG